MVQQRTRARLVEQDRRKPVLRERVTHTLLQLVMSGRIRTHGIMDGNQVGLRRLAGKPGVVRMLTNVDLTWHRADSGDHRIHGLALRGDGTVVMRVIEARCQLRQRGQQHQQRCHVSQAILVWGRGSDLRKPLQQPCQR